MMTNIWIRILYGIAAANGCLFVFVACKLWCVVVGGGGVIFGAADIATDDRRATRRAMFGEDVADTSSR